MNTEKTPLLDDLEEFQGNLEILFAQTAEKRQLVLQSHEDARQVITPDQNNFLQGIGFNNTENIKDFKENEAILQKAGVTLEVIDELKKIKTTYGKSIISYNTVCTLCEKYNLYFGDSSLYIGKIPMENIKEMQDFPFSRFASHYNTVYARTGESIVEGNIATSAHTMIVAPLNVFKLEDIFIANSRELISFKGVTAKCKAPFPMDPIVLLPFKVRATKEIYFLIITHWDNSKSII